MSTATAADWRDQIFETLEAHEIKQVYYVPDAGHSKLIEKCQTSNAMRAIVMTTEEEAMGGALGAWLGGEKSVALMQSSGVGNCINMLGLSKTLRYPMLMIVTMRGDYGEFNPWQYSMGQATPKVLEAVGCIVMSVDRAEDVAATVNAAANMAFEGQQAVAVLLRQKLIGAKSFGKK
ncbi:MAG: phosphonopyruvate decarboxylase [Rhodospirillales bacterium]|nr:phosphonopyruvate decarboxylase [Rhodospirillales bacterium]QQS10508.1 MAG: phosphonopyruvate decarboxylase [Rhodospirillales bacterium]